MSEPARTIPVTILAGFLGAGKTTLLKRVLSEPHGIRFGVLVNDFGAINIDAELIVTAGGEAAGTQVSLANGCICCTIRDDLVTAARQLIAAEPPPEHIIIETSGVSRPLAVAEAFEQPLAGEAAIAAIFCLVDAAGFADLDFAATELAIDQSTAADLVLINKCDIATPAAVAAVEATLTGASPRLRFLRTEQARVPFAVLFGLDNGPRASQALAQGAELHRRADTQGERGSHHVHDHACGPDCSHGVNDHGEEFEAWSWTADQPLDGPRFRRALRELPTGLLRAKGILAIRGEVESRAVLQLVGKRATLDMQRGTPPARSQLVAIGRRGSFDPAALTRLMETTIAIG